MQTRPGWPDLEVCFRIVHIAGGGHHNASVDAYREQTVETAHGGANGAFENGNIGTLRRRALPDQEFCSDPHGRGDIRPPREPKTPRAVELLRKVFERKALLKSGKVAGQGGRNPFPGTNSVRTVARRHFCIRF